jgi:hypothetical protein
LFKGKNNKMPDISIDAYGVDKILKKKKKGVKEILSYNKIYQIIFDYIKTL